MKNSPHFVGGLTGGIVGGLVGGIAGGIAAMEIVSAYFPVRDATPATTVEAPNVTQETPDVMTAISDVLKSGAFNITNKDETSDAVSGKVATRQKEKQEELDSLHTEYISRYLELYEVSAKYINPFFDVRVPGVTFKLRNKGNKSLDMVEVTFYFADASGRVIYEEEYHPVFVYEAAFSSDDKPLKPGYIWQIENGRFYSTKSVPSEWDEGSIVARITDIMFSGEGE